VRLFEVARTFFSTDSLKWTAGGEDWKRFLRTSRLLTHKAKTETGRVIEREILAGVLDQPYSQKEWDRDENATSFYNGKELLSALLRNFGITKVEFVPVDANWLPFVHPNAAAWIVFGRDRLGWVGEIHPQTASSFDLGNDVPVCFELDLEAVFDVHEKQAYKIKQPMRFPAVVRDLALLIATDLTYKDVQTQVSKFPGKKDLTDFRLFDLYQGEQIAEGMKSFAVSCTFQSSERTLTDDEVDAELSGLLTHLKTKLGAVQR
jgi:phenylalanyl-tRNA synthetase beta chain